MEWAIALIGYVFFKERRDEYPALPYLFGFFFWLLVVKGGLELAVDLLEMSGAAQ